MKTWKAILAIILVIALFGTLFAACSVDTNEDGVSSNGTGNNLGSPVHEDVDDVIFWVFDDRGSGVDNEGRIETAINEITEPNGVHVDITYLSFGDYSTKVQISIAGGERVDVLGLLLNSAIASLRTNNVARNDITEIYKTYAADALKVVEPYMGPYMDPEGTIYGLPTQRAHVNSVFYVFNRDVAEELNLVEQIENMTSYSEMEEILAVVKEAYPDWWAFAPNQTYGVIPQTYGGDKFEDSVRVDNLGDSVNMVSANNDGIVELYPATQHYLDSVKLGADWASKGYVWPDGIYDGNDANSNMKAKVAFGMEFGSEGSAVSVAATKTALFEYPVVANLAYTNMLTTSSINFWGISVPVTCEEPEAACKFINMLYTNEALMNVFVHGEEGVDYEVVNGEAVHFENSYSEGNYVVGNNLLTLPVAGAGADYWQRVDEINNSAEISPYMGFLIDSADLELVISQISAVRDQYHQTIVNGGYTEELYQEYLAKLEIAGVQDYLKSVQAQLDAWIAAQ